MLYDPDSDKVLTLREGEHSGSRRVTSITSTSVDIREGATLRTLALRESGGRP